MMLRFILAFLLLMLPAIPAAAQPDVQGSWAFQIADAVIFRFDVEKDEDGEWTGTWTRPASFRSNGVIFSDARGSEDVQSMAALEFAGQVELSFDDPRPGAIPDIFRLELTDQDTAKLIYVGTPLEPYPLIRVDRDTPLGPFAQGRAYHRRDALGQKPATDTATIDTPKHSTEDAQANDPPQDKPAPAPSLGEDILEGR